MKLLQIILPGLILIISSSVYANPVREKFNQAMSAFQKKDYAASVKLFEETLQMYPDLAQAYNFMAMAKKEMGADSGEIVSLLKKALEIEPGLSLAHENLGKIYYSMGEFDKAKEHAQKAVELAPNIVTARLSLAWIYLMGFGETREAIEQFEAAISLQKTDYALFGLGMAYFMDHQRGQVLDMITQLKVDGNQKLARDLEDMIREGKYLPSKGVKSLVAKREKLKKAAAAQPEKPAIPNFKYPVRLSGRLDQAYYSNPTPSGANPYLQQGITSSERIHQLQRNYR